MCITPDGNFWMQPWLCTLREEAHWAHSQLFSVCPVFLVEWGPSQPPWSETLLIWLPQARRDQPRVRQPALKPREDHTMNLAQDLQCIIAPFSITGKEGGHNSCRVLVFDYRLSSRYFLIFFFTSSEHDAISPCSKDIHVQCGQNIRPPTRSGKRPSLSEHRLSSTCKE